MKTQKMKTQKRLTPRTVVNIDYVTHKMMLAHHGEEWTTKFNKALGDGNTMIMVEEDGEQVGGIFVEDYERFANEVDHNKPTYWD